MESPDVLLQSPTPRNGHCEEQRVQPSVVEAFSNVTPRRNDDSLLVAAHSCIFDGQCFGHVILKYNDQLVSVLATNIDDAKPREQDALETTEAQLIAGAKSDGYLEFN